MKYLILFVLVFFAGLDNKTYAQDIHFSQFYENSVLRNPALTGIFSGDYKAGVNYRSQWSNLSIPFTTILAFAETRILLNRATGDYLSIGTTATYDKAGTINFNSVQLYQAINYNKALEDKYNTYLSVGFAGGYIQRTVDISKSTFGTQYTANGYDPLVASGEAIQNTMIQNYDLAAGLSLNGTIGSNKNVNYYLGVAGYHMTRPKQSFNDAFVDLTTKLVSNVGMKCNFNEQYAFTMHGNYTSQGPYKELIGGGMLSWRSNSIHTNEFAVYAGLYMRYKDAIIPTVKLDYKLYSVTVSYDLTTSTLATAHSRPASFEMSLHIRGYYPNKKQSGMQIRCPNFEQMLQSSMQPF